MINHWARSLLIFISILWKKVLILVRLLRQLLLMRRRSRIVDLVILGPNRLVRMRVMVSRLKEGLLLSLIIVVVVLRCGISILRSEHLLTFPVLLVILLSSLLLIKPLV